VKHSLHKILISALLLLFAVMVHAGQLPIVRMFVFTSAKCSHCESVSKENIEKIAGKLGCKVETRYFDVENSGDYAKLCALEAKLGKTAGDMPEVFIGKDVISGEKDTAGRISAALSKYTKVGTPWPDQPHSSKVTHPAASGLSAPSIRFSKISVDLGSIDVGSTAKAIFKFTNTGKGTLEIRRIRSSCGCFKHRLSSSTIKPGASGRIEVDLATDGLVGDFSKSVMVDTNDPGHPTTRLMVKAHIVAISTISPERLNFGSIPVGSSVEKTLTITPARPGSFRIASITPSTHAQVMDTVKADNGTWRVRLRIEAGDQPGRILERLTIHVSGPGKPTIPFTIFGNVVEKAQGNAKSH